MSEVKRPVMTPEERKARERERKREWARKKYASMTEEEIQARRERDRERWENMTPEQREAKNERRRENYRRKQIRECREILSRLYYK